MTRPKQYQQTTNALVAEKIEALKQATEAGFAGVHSRLDTTNGKVLKSVEDIVDLQKSDITLDSKFKYNRFIWYALTVSASTIAALLGYILKN